MKALVTGGGGFLGGAIVRLLLKTGYSVRSFGRSKYPKLDVMNVEVRQGDITDRHAVYEACKGCNIVFHVAAKVGIWGPLGDYYNINVRGTENILQACRSSGISRLIYTSTPSVVFNGEEHGRSR